MAAERQKPARLDWRKPGAGWGAAAFALGGPLNPFALGVFVLALLGLEQVRVGQHHRHPAGQHDENAHRKKDEGLEMSVRCEMLL